MAVTIKDIAQLAGVSRGTVDRVLNERGHVDPDVERRVLALAQQMDYKPSRAAKQLSMKKRKLKFGLISRTDVRGFWSNLLNGVNEAEEELAEYGVSIERRYFNRFQPEEQVALIDELTAQGIAGLVIVPLNDDAVRARLRAAMDAGITVVTINTEIEGIEPLCYIGSDYRKAGQTAAGLMHLFSGGRHLDLMILKGNQYMMSHKERIEGFAQELESLGTDCALVGGFEITSDPAFAYQRAKELLQEHKQVNAVYTVTDSAFAVCRAIRELELVGKISHIGFGLTALTRPCLLDGTMQAAIAQEASRQGYASFKTLFDYLACGAKPEAKRILTRNEIFIRQNCIF